MVKESHTGKQTVGAQTVGMQGHWKGRLIFLELFLGLLLLASMILALIAGRIELTSWQVMRILLSKVLPIPVTWPATLEAVVLDVRLPRMLAGVLIGGGLSIAGAAFQGIFRNPLVSPHILGVSAGAGFGAALAILWAGQIWIIQLSSFSFALLAVGMTYALSRIYRTTPLLFLVLAGIITGSLFTALTSLLKFIADPINQMPSIVFWLMGSLNNVSNRDLSIAGTLIAAGIAALCMVRWRINVLTMGEETAQALGINTARLNLIIIVSATIISAAAVCISGVIGWIGLVIPHIGRLLVGPDYRRLIPVSGLVGASFLVLVDTAARTLSPSEIPIGIITALAGAPIFAVLLRKCKTGW